MILPKMAVKVCKPVGKLIFQLKKYSPQILLGLGIVGYGGSVYFAGKAGEKAKKAQNTYLRDRDKKKFIKGYVKAWGPTMGLFCVSTASVVGGHVILRGRYIAAGMALEATRRAFKQYRERVVAKEGKDADICYRNGLVEKVRLEDEEVIHEFTEVAPIDRSDYYRMTLDERNPLYDPKDLHGSLLRLRERLRELNILLDTSIDDRMTFKEVLIRSGFKWRLINDEDFSKFAGRVGWKHGSKTGDNYISYGPMFEKILEDPRDFLMGRTPPIVFEFNCDGDIYNIE